MSQLSAFDASDDASDPGPLARPRPVPLTRFQPPPLPPAHHVRDGLLELLDSARRAGLTAVTGPIGSGKTTLVSAWARADTAPGPVAWLTLSTADNNPDVFWSGVLESLRRNVPGFDAGRPDRSTTARLASRLSVRSAPVVLVLDRAEVIANRTIGADLDLLLRYSTPGLRLVVVGRGAHLVPLHRYRLTGDLLEIGAADLALTPTETADILRGYGVVLPGAEVDALHEGTEGWVTAVCLHARTMRAGRAAPRYPDPGGRRAIANLLRAEILDAEPPWVGDLLLRTSILDEVDPGLANHLAGRCDAPSALDRLARAHALVTQVHPSRFRYQRPLRTMLRDTLAATRPDLVQPLHAAAARWYAEHRSPAAAVTHAARAGDWDFAVGTAVEQLGVAWLLTAPEGERCRTVLADLPDERPGVSAELLRSVLALARYDTAAARRAVDRARKCADRLGPPSPTVLLGIATVEVILARLGGGLDTAEPAVARAEAGWRAIPAGASVDEPRTRTLILANLGVAQLWAGRLAAARATLDRAATSTEPGTEYAAHDALGHLALLEMYEGKMHQADKYARESLAIADRAGIRPAARTGAASATLAAIALVWNDLAAAREHVAHAIQATGSRQDPPTTVTIALVRAWAACMCHDGRRAVAATETARGHLPRQHAPQLIGDRIELTALWGYLILGDLTAARGCVDRIRDPAERTLGLGYLLEAEGDQARARTALAGVSAHNARPSDLQYAALALGRLALADGDLPAATDALRDALDYGRPERRRRPVSDAGGWTRQLLRNDAALAGQHGWLRPPADAAGTGSVPTPNVEPLTRRELDVLRCLTEALSTKDIAEALYLSVNTVKTHLKSIYRKLGTSGRSATARRARELNLLRDTDQG